VVQQTLSNFGYPNIGLKWPNDLLVGNAKLGGILIESKQVESGLQIVCGIGINVLSKIEDQLIEQPAISLQDISRQQTSVVSRNQIAAKFTEGLISLCLEYPDSGFSNWQEKWQQLHILQDTKIKAIEDGQEYFGIAVGVDELGAFLLQHEDGYVRKFISSNTSIRKI